MGESALSKIASPHCCPTIASRVLRGPVSSLSDFVRKSFVFNTTRVYVEKYSIET